MRILNDRGDNKAKQVVVPVSSILLQAFLVGIGANFVFFGVFSVVVAQLKLGETFGRIASLLGIAGALMLSLADGRAGTSAAFFSIGISFWLLVVGFYIADVYLKARDSAFGVIIKSLGLTILMVLLVLKSASKYSGGQFGIIETWTNYVSELLSSTVVESMAQMGGNTVDPQIWNLVIERVQGISGLLLFAQLAGVLVWLNIGLLAHLKWVPSNHALGSRTIRESVAENQWLYIALVVITVLNILSFEGVEFSIVFLILQKLSMLIGLILLGVGCAKFFNFYLPDSAFSRGLCYTVVHMGILCFFPSAVGGVALVVWVMNRINGKKFKEKLTI